jgi:hypothetical protein
MENIKISGLFAFCALALLSPATQATAQTTDEKAPAHAVVLSHVPSDRKWRFGMNNRSYEKTSTELEDLTAKALSAKGMTRAEQLSGNCCKLVIEVVEISQHVAAFGKAGMDLVATLSVQDAGGKQVFSKVFRGESRTAGMHTWGAMLDMAEKLLVDSAFASPELTAALNGSAN